MFTHVCVYICGYILKRIRMCVYTMCVYIYAHWCIYINVSSCWYFWKVRWHCNHSKVYFLDIACRFSAETVKSTDFSHQLNLPLKCVFLWRSPSTAGLFSNFTFLFHLPAAYLSFQIHYLSLLPFSCCVPIFNDLFYVLFYNVYICRMNWFYNPPKWVLWFIFLAKLMLSAAEQPLAGSDAHPGPGARWLHCGSHHAFWLSQSRAWIRMWASGRRWPGWDRNFNIAILIQTSHPSIHP